MPSHPPVTRSTHTSTHFLFQLYFFPFLPPSSIFFFFFFNDTATTEIYTLSLHDALPILLRRLRSGLAAGDRERQAERRRRRDRSEEHTSELQSRRDLVCRLLLEKKKKKIKKKTKAYRKEH